MCKAEKRPLLGAEVGNKKDERREGEEGGQGDEEEEVVENCRSWLVVLASFLCICMLDGSMYSNGVFTNTLTKVNGLQLFSSNLNTDHKECPYAHV